MASNSGWSKEVPSDSSQIAQGDDAIRSFKSHMEAGWEEEHYFTDGSANSFGVHKIGSARAYQGPASELSNPTGDGSHRLFHNTDEQSLYVANPSTSSWSRVGTSTEVANTWSATQTFSDIAVTGKFLSLHSHAHGLGGDQGVASNATAYIQFTQPVDVIFGDFVIPSFTSAIFDASGTNLFSPRLGLVWDDSINSLTGISIWNDTKSLITFPSNTTFGVLAFRRETP